MIKEINETVEYLQAKGFDNPEIGIILGTGLGQLINEVEIFVISCSCMKPIQELRTMLRMNPTS